MPSVVRVGLVVVTSLSMAGVAVAQPAGGAPAPVAPVAPPPGAGPSPVAPPPPPPADHKSPGLASALALGATVGAVGLGALAIHQDSAELGVAAGLGLTLAPSAGHWYAGTVWAPGLPWRLAGAGAMLLGLAIACPDCEGGDEQAIAGLAVGMCGAAVFLGGTVKDLASASRYAREHNARRPGPAIAVAPSLGHGQLGVVVAGGF